MRQLSNPPPRTRRRRKSTIGGQRHMHSSRPSLTFVEIWVLWPLPMYAANYIFSKTVSSSHSVVQFFTAWVSVSLTRLWITFLVIAVYPVWDGRRQITAVLVGLFQGRGGGNFDILSPRAIVEASLCCCEIGYFSPQIIILATSVTHLSTPMRVIW
ncbi:hypothetical protein BJX64DRAFT_258769 [Aspergillus heterothallicus]